MFRRGRKDNHRLFSAATQHRQLLALVYGELRALDLDAGDADDRVRDAVPAMRSDPSYPLSGLRSGLADPIKAAEELFEGDLPVGDADWSGRPFAIRRTEFARLIAVAGERMAALSRNPTFVPGGFQHGAALIDLARPYLAHAAGNDGHQQVQRIGQGVAVASHLGARADHMGALAASQFQLSDGSPLLVRRADAEQRRGVR